VARQSDRWITPTVVVTALVVGAVLVLAVVAAVTYLAAIGRDPGPMLDLVAKVVTAIGSLGSLVVSLANRATATRTERNTAPLAPGGVPVSLASLAATDRLYGGHSRPPVPTRTAPAPPGS
jgi:hypothetical protein